MNEPALAPSLSSVESRDPTLSVSSSLFTGSPADLALALPKGVPVRECRTGCCSRRALVVEGPEQSDHSDAPDLSDDDSFMNLDSPIPSPKAPQDYDSELELPTVEWRSPSPLEYIPDSDLPSTQIGPLLQSVPETEDLADHDEQENGSSAPATMPDAVSSAPTSSESAPPGITVTPNLGAEPTARRSGRKRKEREELKDLSAALSACICGSSAAPLDSSEHPNVVTLKATTYDKHRRQAGRKIRP
ncbi:hypothetical protein B0H10DRAFT_2255178 [Mycena sp. CBHHK59/15]|nr:hypothetical protein B0H10DRAFT_2255178 [Mycena sp. CBHHK59/15]